MAYGSLPLTATRRSCSHRSDGTRRVPAGVEPLVGRSRAMAMKAPPRAATLKSNSHAARSARSTHRTPTGSTWACTWARSFPARGCRSSSARSRTSASPPSGGRARAGCSCGPSTSAGRTAVSGAVSTCARSACKDRRRSLVRCGSGRCGVSGSASRQGMLPRRLRPVRWSGPWAPAPWRVLVRAMLPGRPGGAGRRLDQYLSHCADCNRAASW
jgi:hypothetical protein